MSPGGAGPVSFHTTILLSGKTATGVRVPDHVVEALGAGKRPPVRVTIRGYTYRSSIAVMGGVFMLGVSDEVRRNAGVVAGDEVDIDLELDTAPRTVDVPDDLSRALDAEPAARSGFDRFSYSNRLRLVLSVEGAKTDETRQRRIAKAVDESKAAGTA